ncbi:MAG: hypothetical protein M1823_004071 [Watsoniomyces obsoletus]|nr:MAG: hypothetical protein M1823_004071 [Watsoniomyces obsoletus]
MPPYYGTDGINPEPSSFRGRGHRHRHPGCDGRRRRNAAIRAAAARTAAAAAAAAASSPPLPAPTTSLSGGALNMDDLRNLALRIDRESSTPATSPEPRSSDPLGMVWTVHPATQMNHEIALELIHRYNGGLPEGGHRGEGEPGKPLGTDFDETEQLFSVMIDERPRDCIEVFLYHVAHDVKKRDAQTEIDMVKDRALPLGTDLFGVDGIPAPWRQEVMRVAGSDEGYATAATEVESERQLVHIEQPTQKSEELITLSSPQDVAVVQQVTEPTGRTEPASQDNSQLVLASNINEMVGSAGEMLTWKNQGSKLVVYILATSSYSSSSTQPHRLILDRFNHRPGIAGVTSLFIYQVRPFPVYRLRIANKHSNRPITMATTRGDAVGIITMLWANYDFSAKAGGSPDPTLGMLPVRETTSSGPDQAGDDTTIASVQRWIDASARFSALGALSASSAVAVPVLSEDLLVDVPLMAGTTLFKTGEVPGEVKGLVFGGGGRARVGSGSEAANVDVPVPPRRDVRRYFEDKEEPTTTTTDEGNKPNLQVGAIGRISGSHFLPFAFEEEIQRPLQSWPTSRSIQMSGMTNRQAAGVKKTDDEDLLCLDDGASYGAVATSKPAAPQDNGGEQPPRMSLLDQSDNQTITALDALSTPVSLNVPAPIVSTAAVIESANENATQSVREEDSTKEDTIQSVREENTVQPAHEEASAKGTNQSVREDDSTKEEELVAPVTPAKKTMALFGFPSTPKQKASPKTPQSTFVTPSKTVESVPSTPTSFKTAKADSPDGNSLADITEEAPSDHNATDTSLAEIVAAMRVADATNIDLGLLHQKTIHASEIILWTPPAANRVYTAIQMTLERALTHPGPVTMGFHLGRIFRKVTGAPSPRVSVDGTGDVFASMEEPVFNTAVTTSIDVVDSIIDMKHTNGGKFFQPRPDRKTVVFEFYCINELKDHIMIEVNAETFEWTASQWGLSIGSAYIHYPEHSLDAHMRVVGRIPAREKDQEVAREFVSRLWIKPDDTEVILAVDPNIRVASVLLKRSTQHLVRYPLSVHPPSRIVLQVTEVQHLMVQRVPNGGYHTGLRAYNLPRGEMMNPVIRTATGTIVEGSRLWFEIEIMSSTANETMKWGNTLPWKPDQAVTKETANDLWRVLEGVINSLDEFVATDEGEGYGHDNPGNKGKKRVASGGNQVARMDPSVGRNGSGRGRGRRGGLGYQGSGNSTFKNGSSGGGTRVGTGPSIRGGTGPRFGIGHPGASHAGTRFGPGPPTGPPTGPRTGTGPSTGPHTITGPPIGRGTGTGPPTGPRTGTGLPIGRGTGNGPPTGPPTGPRPGIGAFNGRGYDNSRDVRSGQVGRSGQAPGLGYQGGQGRGQVGQGRGQVGQGRGQVGQGRGQGSQERGGVSQRGSSKGSSGARQRRERGLQRRDAERRMFQNAQRDYERAQLEQWAREVHERGPNEAFDTGFPFTVDANAFAGVTGMTGYTTSSAAGGFTSSAAVGGFTSSAAAGGYTSSTVPGDNFISGTSFAGGSGQNNGGAGTEEAEGEDNTEW